MNMELGRLHEKLNPLKPAEAVKAYKAVLRVCPAALDAARCLARIGTPSEELTSLTCTNAREQGLELPTCTAQWLRGASFRC